MGPPASASTVAREGTGVTVSNMCVISVKTDRWDLSSDLQPAQARAHSVRHPALVVVVGGRAEEEVRREENVVAAGRKSLPLVLLIGRSVVLLQFPNTLPGHFPLTIDRSLAQREYGSTPTPEIFLLR